MTIKRRIYVEPEDTVQVVKEKHNFSYITDQDGFELLDKDKIGNVLSDNEIIIGYNYSYDTHGKKRDIICNRSTNDSVQMSECNSILTSRNIETQPTKKMKTSDISNSVNTGVQKKEPPKNMLNETDKHTGNGHDAEGKRSANVNGKYEKKMKPKKKITSTTEKTMSNQNTETVENGTLIRNDGCGSTVLNVGNDTVIAKQNISSESNILKDRISPRHNVQITRSRDKWNVHTKDKENKGNADRASGINGFKIFGQDDSGGNKRLTLDDL